MVHMIERAHTSSFYCSFRAVSQSNSRTFPFPTEKQLTSSLPLLSLCRLVHTMGILSDQDLTVWQSLSPHVVFS